MKKPHVHRWGVQTLKDDFGVWVSEAACDCGETRNVIEINRILNAHEKAKAGKGKK